VKTVPRTLCQGKLRCKIEFPHISSQPSHNSDPKYIEPFYDDAVKIPMLAQVELKSQKVEPQLQQSIPNALRTHVIRRKVKWKAQDEDESEAQYGPEEEEVVVTDSEDPQSSSFQQSSPSLVQTQSTFHSFPTPSSSLPLPLPLPLPLSSSPSSSSSSSLGESSPFHQGPSESLSSMVQVEVLLPEDEQQQLVAESQVKGCEVNRTLRCSDGFPLRKLVSKIGIEVGCGASMPDQNIVNEIVGDVLNVKFGACCTLHNICYATFGSDKDDCDFAFYRCMLRKCSGWLCKAKAFGYYQAVSDGGCSSFDVSQKLHNC